MSFFLFDQQFQVNDPHTSVEGSQRHSARMNDNNGLHEEFLIPFEESTLLLTRLRQILPRSHSCYMTEPGC